MAPKLQSNNATIKKGFDTFLIYRNTAFPLKNTSGNRDNTTDG